MATHIRVSYGLQVHVIMKYRKVIFNHKIFSIDVMIGDAEQSSKLLELFDVFHDHVHSMHTYVHTHTSHQHFDRLLK